MKQPFVIKPSRNATLQKAWAGLRADERKEKRAKKESEPAVPAKKAKGRKESHGKGN